MVRKAAPRWARPRAATTTLATALLLPLLAGAEGAEPPVSSSAPPQIREWIIHFDARVEDICSTAYRGLLRQIPRSTDVTVVLADQRDEALFHQLMDLPQTRWDRISFLIGGPTLSPWARDRYVILERFGKPAVVLPDPLLVRAGRQGDLQVALSLGTRELRHRVVQTNLDIEGGDILIGKKIALVGGETVARNARRLGIGNGEIVAVLAHALGRRIIVVGAAMDELPHEHLDMYVHLLSDSCVLVGDPRAVLVVLMGARQHRPDRLRLDELGPTSRAEQLAAAGVYDAVAEDLRRSGLRVERVPAVQMRNGDVVLSWTNVVAETRDGIARAYVPSYRLPALDARAHATWRRLGYRVHPIDVGIPIQEGGGIRCLTNVIREAAAPRTADRPVRARQAAASALR